MDGQSEVSICPARRASDKEDEANTPVQFQFLPPPEGILADLGAAPHLAVSILAPARRASKCPVSVWPVLHVSILAPARRASAAGIRCRHRTDSFNSRPRTEGISHTGGLTAKILLFQFSPPHGGHRALSVAVDVQLLFQFSPPHGGHQPQG